MSKTGKITQKDYVRFDEKLCFKRNGILFERGNGARTNLNAKTKKKNQRTTYTRANRETQKEQKDWSRVKRKKAYWEVEFMFFWLMQDFFRAS